MFRPPDFPDLTAGRYALTSPRDPRYNCIAWAAGDVSRWWWPLANLPAGYYWPDWAPRVETLDAFRVAFEGLGYAEVKEPGALTEVEVVAIYANDQGTPTHAARGLDTGGWTSKLGKSIDIAHPRTEHVEGPAYGRVALRMSRTRQTPAVDVGSPSTRPSDGPGGEAL